MGGVTKTQIVKFIRMGNGVSSVTEYYLASASSSGVTVSTTGWTTTIQTITATKKYLWNYEVITYSNGTKTTTTPVIIGTYGEKGDKGDTGETGERGPVLRGPQAWSDCATGYAFQAGGTGEKWQDVVLYNGNYYSCVKSHTKTASNYPGSTTANNNGYWQLGDKIELVATKILLATYALVENLGVTAIDMKDAAGNILFQAKDGNVTCKTGTFENVRISGDLTVSQLKYKANMTYGGAVNCSFIFGGGSYVMPTLESGEYMRITLFNPQLTRSYNPTTLTGKNAGDGFLADGGNYFTDTVTSVELVGWYEFIGVGMGGGYTLWLYQTIREY